MATQTKYKTYALLEHTEGTVPHFLRINKDQRVQFKKRPYDSPFLETTFTDKNGTNKSIRLRLNSNTIDLDEQVKQGIPSKYFGRDGMPYSVPPSDRERDAVMFRNGIRVTNIPIVQQFFEAHPQNDDFDGVDRGGLRPLFKLVDKAVETKSNNDLFRKQAKATQRILALTEIKEAQDLLILLNGTHFKVPGVNATTDEEKEEALEEIISMLVEFLNDADDVMLDKLLSGEVSTDEEILLVVSRALSMDVLSFNQGTNSVSVKRNKEWKPVKIISSELPKEERERLFVEFLSTKEAAPLLNDIKNLIGEGEAKAKKTKKPEAVEA